MNLYTEWCEDNDRTNARVLYHIMKNILKSAHEWRRHRSIRCIYKEGNL